MTRIYLSENAYLNSNFGSMLEGALDPIRELAAGLQHLFTTVTPSFIKQIECEPCMCQD
jgi:hypothetical protein